MTINQNHSTVTKGFFYTRSVDGCDETWDIYGPDSDRPISCIPFWDDGDGIAAARTEPFARMFTAAYALRDSLREMVGVVSELPVHSFTEPFLEAFHRATAILAEASETGRPAKDLLPL